MGREAKGVKRELIGRKWIRRALVRVTAWEKRMGLLGLRVCMARGVPGVEGVGRGEAYSFWCRYWGV